MKNIVWSACAAICLTAALQAQDKMMPAEGKMQPMTSAKSYTGCLTRSATGSFTLENAMSASTAMKAAPAAKADGMMHDGMTHDGMMHDGMAAAEPLHLSGRVQFGKHVGQRVTVTGTTDDSMAGMTMFTVTSVKTVAKTCR